MAGKIPAFMFYPKDWQADSVFGCSLAARGLWLELLNVMHGCEPYGHLAENGRPMPEERIARKCGATVEEYATLLAELEAAGVPRRTRAGIIYSKRMVEDQQKRAEWRKRQQKHRDKDASSNEPVTHAVTRLSRPSSSSSSSSFPKKEKSKSLRARDQGFLALTEEDDAARFAQFAEAYPPHRRPTDPEWEDAHKIWKRLSVHEQLEAIKSLTSWKEFWAGDLPRYVPAMAKFLRLKRWQGKPPLGKEKSDGKRKQPGSDSTQDHIDRLRRNAEILGLHNP